MNLPNKLTLSRVIMVPFFVACALCVPYNATLKWIALGIFIIASLTDLLDGYLARKYNLITNFGKFMDPLADKLLVCSALIALSSLGVIPAWITIIIIAREFIISGFRLIAAEKGVVIAAGIWGKWKTTFQMIMICVKLVVMDFYPGANNGTVISAEAIHPVYSALLLIGEITMYIALILTIISLIDYLASNKDVLKDVE